MSNRAEPGRIVSGTILKSESTGGITPQGWTINKIRHYAGLDLHLIVSEVKYHIWRNVSPPRNEQSFERRRVYPLSQMRDAATPRRGRLR